MRSWLVVAALCGGAGCTFGAEQPLKEYMGHVVAFAAQNVWNKQGWISDRTGTHSLLPKTDQEWEDAESASLTLAAVIELLAEPDHRLPFPGWSANAQRVRKLAQESASAAEKHDGEAFMRLGSDLDEACEACHIASGVK